MSEADRRYTAKFRVHQARVKLELGCAECGYDENADALEFDHIVGGGPRARSSSNFTWLKRMLADPNVQLLCGNCHNIKSNRERRERMKVA